MSKATAFLRVSECKFPPNVLILKYIRLILSILALKLSEGGDNLNGTRNQPFLCDATPDRFDDCAAQDAIIVLSSSVSRNGLKRLTGRKQTSSVHASIARS
eukprot:scaffold22653_cov119-Cylindrotheca_fusiformis.AAC.10